MLVSNAEVAQAWAEGRPAQGSNMFTDGRSVYSYDLLIGRTFDGSTKVALDYSKEGRTAVCASTGRHVALLKAVAHRIAKPAMGFCEARLPVKGGGRRRCNRPTPMRRGRGWLCIPCQKRQEEAHR